ncbi:uncharacterized protein LOC113211691 [Frankliniella occidentalis]|uniref:Uncharacterized protein LOC113211691 n=1 Tax=Frankliniella occidentalis TaxID=133901 RepID=A0A9C6WTJ8_FRAOC|nr:uncharacterized protein LOC113211691 [Frankliniella occidentalis]
MLVGTLLAAWLAVTVASGAKIPVDDEEPKGCAFRGQVYAVGERWATGPPNKCAKYICEGDDQIAAVTCPWFVPAPGCRALPGDEDAVYPGCCPVRKCHEPVQDHAVTTTSEAPTTSEATTAAAAALEGRAATGMAHDVIKLSLTTDRDSTTTATATEGAVDEEDVATGTVLTPTMTPPPAV